MAHTNAKEGSIPHRSRASRSRSGSEATGVGAERVTAEPRGVGEENVWAGMFRGQVCEYGGARLRRDIGSCLHSKVYRLLWTVADRILGQTSAGQDTSKCKEFYCPDQTDNLDHLRWRSRPNSLPSKNINSAIYNSQRFHLWNKESKPKIFHVDQDLILLGTPRIFQLWKYKWHFFFFTIQEIWFKC
jgi:hypothetical protein